MAYRPKERIFTPSLATATVIGLATMKDQLRISHNYEDALINSLIASAVSMVERRTQRLLSARAAVLRLPDLPDGKCPIELPGGAVQSVTSVLADGVAITGTSALGDSPAVLVPTDDWPVVTGEVYPVVVTYQVGYTTAPAELLHAAKMIATELYEQRGQSSVDSLSKVPLSVEWLMEPYRIMAI